MTPSVNEPATFRFVAQCLNQLCLRIQEKRHNLLFAQIYLINVTNLPKFFSETLL